MKILFVYLVIINLLSLFLMAEDKRRARRHLWRIPERTLFAAALVGGSVGALLSMYLFHHKTHHWYCGRHAADFGGTAGGRVLAVGGSNLIFFRQCGLIYN